MTLSKVSTEGLKITLDEFIMTLTKVSTEDLKITP
jgi:hypothetical protein